jgi:hypothetical protein
VNEELQTLNNEHQTKIAEITRANEDLDNFIASADIATIFSIPDSASVASLLAPPRKRVFYRTISVAQITASRPSAARPRRSSRTPHPRR